MQMINLTGQTFGMLTVLRLAPKLDRRTRWLCQCACGSPEKAIEKEKLTRGNTISCGCHRATAIGNRQRTHGKSQTREYNIWNQMKGRCQNLNDPVYERYGGRGILVAPEFQAFEGFIAHLGPCPPGLTLERLDNNKGYEPGNVCWATYIQQGRNKRNNHLITFNGRTQAFSAWAEELGITPTSLRDRLRTGWSMEKALTTPKSRFWSDAKSPTKPDSIDENI